MPNADITADRFHVMKQINMELDTARKIEKKSGNVARESSQTRENISWFDQK